VYGIHPEVPGNHLGGRMDKLFSSLLDKEMQRKGKETIL